MILLTMHAGLLRLILYCKLYNKIINYEMMQTSQKLIKIIWHCQCNSVCYLTFYFWNPG